LLGPLQAIIDSDRSRYGRQQFCTWSTIA